jgi:hypothetical protein
MLVFNQFDFKMVAGKVIRYFTDNLYSSDIVKVNLVL